MKRFNLALVSSMKHIFWIFGLCSLLLSYGCNPSLRIQFQSTLPEKVVCVNDEEPLYDGRFSLGANGQNLTYSWFGDEATWATSHFVVRLYNIPGSYHGIDSAQDFFASNYPVTSRSSDHDLNKYLKGELYQASAMGARQTIIDYEVNGILIRQELTPVRSNFNDMKWRRHKPAFYRIKYTLTNTNPRAGRIGFQARLDPQLRQSDDCILELIKQRQSLGKILNVFDRIPDEVEPNVNNKMSNKKWSRNLNAIRVHENKTVERNKTMGFIFTGNRRKNLQPRRIQLGSWQAQREQLWTHPRGGGKYEDSGVIMEWDINLAAGSSQEITYYYGLYQPGWGKRLFGRLVKPEKDVQLALQQPVDYLAGNYVRLDQDSAWIGDSVRLEWNIFHRECCPDKLDQLLSNVDGLDYYSGQTWVPANCRDEEYFMSLRLEKSKVRAIWGDSLFAIHPYPSFAGIMPTPGMFTLGGDGKPLLFGYPYPSTTSHFVVRSENVEEPSMLSRGSEVSSPETKRIANFNLSYFASNEREVANGVRLTPEQFLLPDYPRPQMQWALGYPFKFSGHLVFPLTNGVDSLYLEQRITPWSNDPTGSEEAKSSTFYRVDYVVRNTSCEKSREFDLAFMLDPKLNKDERGLIQMGQTTLPVNESFTLDEPEYLKIIPTETDSSPALDIMFGLSGTPKPQTVYNTLWQAQRRRVSGVSEDLTILDDRALFIQWETRTLGPGEKASYSFVLGSERAKRTDLLYSNPIRHQETLWFDFDRDTLIRGEIRVLREVFDKYLSGKTIESSLYSHIVLEGFTGSLGSDGYNRGLARRRLDHIIGWLTRWGVPKEQILTKINGEYYAEDEPMRQRIRNSERVVLMKVY